MYNTLKKVLKKTVSEDFIIRHEENFRKLTIPFYFGNRHQCNICGVHLKKFAVLPNGEKICPVCGSIPRARRLYKILNEKYIKKDDKVLDFSPFRVLYRNFKKRKDFQYFPSDFEDDFLADYHFDITNIACDTESFDTVICYHILEHIIEDERAIGELYRILKKDGTVLVQTPYKEGEIYEDYTITAPEDRLEHFGQDNHVRIYSVKGLTQRLEKAGFSVSIETFPKDEFLGLTENEKILICQKK